MTYRQVEGALVEDPEARPTNATDASGIDFPVDLPLLEDEIRFLDGPDSPAGSGSPREHLVVGGVEKDRDDEIARERGCNDG